MMTRLIILITAISAFSWSCSHTHEEAHEDTTHQHEPGVIVLHEHSAGRFGVKTDTVSPTQFHTVVKAAGCVVQASGEDAVASAPTAGIVHFNAGINPGSTLAKGAVVATVDARSISGGDANAAAKAELESAAAELERVQDLYTERLATQGELLAAQASYEKAKAAFSPSASTGRITSPIAGSVIELLVKEGQYVSAGEPVAAIGKGAGSILRVDLPRRYYAQAADFNDLTADFTGLDNFRISDRGGKRTGGITTPQSDLSGGYLPIYFSVAGVGAPIGTPFTAYLIGNDRQDVITVPTAALSEQQGQTFVYLHSGGEHYIKQPVTTGQNDGLRTEIISGLKTGDIVVTEGVSAVRLAETSAVAPQGHTHNH